ncbi:F-box protein [Aspergillus glaucus CBS 516.65]|uniref:F-box domain-containing protein n=1 Tax=Aspergillus glaucus CBS 516.65 TaxID=1160497 RepID=A0A1L9VLJ1_ASPGL|nr:hypothetical protein ASPGLDRAFT_46691 [Aspergillus glaucus CBS 516.65]OJJ84783.1 hypothetical protein ASPGLDRAFT_46691 [Aspergillus glaucus CBS 516.65]
MTRFSLIPVEIFYSIFSLLSKPDLSRLSRTCKQIHQLATPRLWRSYRNYNQQPYNLFLRAVLTNPDLAKHIIELHTSNVSEDDPREISEEDIESFQSAVSDLSLPIEFKDRLNEGIKEGYSDPMLALSLCKLPNLKNLFLYRPDFSDLICELFDHANSGEFSGLDNLRRFSIETTDVSCAVGTVRDFGGVFNRAHEVQIVQLNDENMSPSRFREGTSAVEHLHILESGMGTDAMRVFVQGCRTLRTFNYTFGNVDYYEDHFKPQEAVKELEHHKDTLEELTVLYCDDRLKQSWYDLTGREWYMGTELQQFNKLKKLRSGMHSLLGLLHPQTAAMETYPANPQTDRERPELVDVLPASIEHLTILYADARIIPHLQKVGDVREKQFPSLKKVIVGLCSESTEKDVQLEIPGLDLLVLYQTQEEREAYVYDRDAYSWVGSPVFRD